VQSLLDSLDVRTPHLSRGVLSTPKQIAALSLFVQARYGLPAEPALQTAVSALAERLRSTPGGLKKATSEARAILQFGLGDDRVAAVRAEPGEQLLQAIETAIRGVNLRQVTQARAAALRGVRGGRPVGKGKTAYGAVQKLLALVAAGEAEARAELAAIEDLIRSASRPADHLVAIR